MSAGVVHVSLDEAIRQMIELGERNSFVIAEELERRHGLDWLQAELSKVVPGIAETWPTVGASGRCKRCGCSYDDTTPHCRLCRARHRGRLVSRLRLWTWSSAFFALGSAERQRTTAAIGAYAVEHGQVPRASDISPAVYRDAKRLFGSWPAAVAAAGQAPRRGRRPAAEVAS